MRDSSSKLKLTHAIAMLLAFLLTACGSSFEEGAYVETRFGTTYEFGPDGQGRVLGGVPGTPGFTYQVESGQVVMQYIDTPGATATFRRIDGKTLERPDGARLTLREPD